MSMMLAVLPGCQLLNLDTTYEAHYKKAEYQIKEKTISDRWKSKASQVGVVSKKEADHIIYNNVKEALLVNNTTNKVLVSQHVFDKAYPASTTKTMTALLTLEHLKLNDVVTIKHDITFKDSAAVALHLKKGDKITVESLLNGLIIMSANDAAVALAEAVGGSVKNFVSMMNERAKELGATHTHFANPNGLHLNNHYTTAYDLYLIFKELTKHNEYFNIAGKANSYIEYKDAKGKMKTYDMAATNEYLTGDFNLPHQVFMIGGKTGTTTQAGSCLIILTKNKNGEEFISVMLKAQGKPALYNSMTDMLTNENKK
ncbi:serine hydrolase [Anaerostipes sp. MSJ-23]|nr:serine hydrolase [Anaerostipes sp. MSJ-23]